MMRPRTRIKICCIASVEEAREAISAGADAVGLVSAMPSGPGPISEETIREIRRRVPPPIATFLLTCRQDIDSIAAQLRFTGCNFIQQYPVRLQIIGEIKSWLHCHPNCAEPEQRHYDTTQAFN